MAQDSEFGDDGTSGLSQFEKNRFYQGKLMTPRDMEAEQAYHAERLHALARFVAGSGIAYGLEVGSIAETADGVEVTIEPGLAIDGRGRPIVVDQPTTKTLPEPSADELHLYVRYDEVALESVPIADTQGTGSDERAANRAVEVFELSYQETPATEDAGVPSVDTRVADGAELDPDEVAQGVAASYHERHRSDVESSNDPGVYVGSFERAPDGSWQPAEDAADRTFVPDNQFLYAALIDHVTDTENPHRTTVEEPSREPPEGLDNMEAITTTLETLQNRVDQLEGDNDRLRRYVVRNALKDTRRHFTALADQLTDKPGFDGRLARAIGNESEAAVGDGAIDDPAAFRSHAETLLDMMLQFDEDLEEAASGRDYERYEDGVTALADTLESESASTVDVAEALDRVSEAADSTEVVLEVSEH